MSEKSLKKIIKELKDAIQNDMKKVPNIIESVEEGLIMESGKYKILTEEATLLIKIENDTEIIIDWKQISIWEYFESRVFKKKVLGERLHLSYDDRYVSGFDGWGDQEWYIEPDVVIEFLINIFNEILNS